MVALSEQAVWKIEPEHSEASRHTVDRPTAVAPHALLRKKPPAAYAPYARLERKIDPEQT
jgi:hypothetical protein